jgi:hypothetical protein
MATTVTNKLMSLVAGGTFLASLLGSTATNALLNQGGQGATGPTGSQGPAGETGEAGQDGREVEFSVDGNTLVWRYEGETRWNTLDLDLGQGGSGSIVNSGGTERFTHWIFAEEALSIPFPERQAEPAITNSATYAAAKVAEGYTAINNLQDLLNISLDITGQYVLTANIDVSTRSEADVLARPFNIIPEVLDANNEAIPFSGTLDGAGYTISNFVVDTTIDSQQINSAGLFQELAGATIKNLVLNDFSYTDGNNSYRLGTLASSIVSSTISPTIIDNVTVNDFSYLNTIGGLTRLGGLVGDIESDATALVYRTAVNRMTVDFQSTSSSYQVGGLFGMVDGSLVLGDSSTLITFETAETHRIAQSGGAIGEMQSSAVVQVDGGDFEIIGELDYQVGGFSGSVDGNLSLTNSIMTVEIGFISDNGPSAGAYGGIAGNIDTQTIILIDQVETNGVLVGDDGIGGFIGQVDDESFIRIENSTNKIDIFGTDDIGGIIGETGANGQMRLLLDNVTTEGDISNHFLNSNFGINLETSGGFIGHLRNSDSSDQNDWNQIWIRNSTVDNIQFNFFGTVTDNGGGGLYSLYLSETFSEIGGAIGYVYEENFLRLSNNDISLDINALFDGYEIQYNDINLNEIGGLIGYIEYDSEFQFLNNVTDLTINVDYKNNVSVVDSSTYNQLRFDDIGGAVGRNEEGTIIDVAGDYTLTLNVDASNNNFNLIEFNFTMEQIGGYIGDTDSDALLLVADLDLSLVIDTNLDLGENPSYQQINIRVQDIGSIIGDMGGFAFLDNVYISTDVVFNLPEATEGISVNNQDLETIQYTGNNYSFYVLTLNT